jgi:transposase
MALGLQNSWQVESIGFKEGAKGGRGRDLTLGFPRGSVFPDGKGQTCAAHDTVQRAWEYLNFFDHVCLLHCKAPRIQTSDAGRSKRSKSPVRAPATASPCCLKPWLWL